MGLKYSISNIAWGKDADEKMYEFLKQNHVQGIEIAPTRIFPENPYNKLDEAKKYSDFLLKNYELSISSIQSIWYGITYKMFGPDNEREKLFDYTLKAIQFAAVIGAKNIVFGCPKNRRITDSSNYPEAVAFFKRLGDYAKDIGVTVGMEANPDIYGTNFINTTEDALTLIKDVNSEGFKLNLDIGTVIHNNECLDWINKYSSLINHVHISEPFLKKIISRNLHKELIASLVDNQFDGYVSIEMGRLDDIHEVQEIVHYVMNIESEVIKHS